MKKIKYENEVSIVNHYLRKHNMIETEWNFDIKFMSKK